MIRKLIIVLLTCSIFYSPVLAGTFRDDFEDGDLAGWRLWPFGDQSAKWFVKEGELVAISENVCGVASGFILGNNAWKNYEFECQFKIEQTFPLSNL